MITGMHSLLFTLVALALQGTASVDGIVLKMGSGEPLSGVTVQLHPEKAERELGPRDIEFYSVKTGQDGKFVIGNVLPGEYRLIATRINGGYVPAEYGQRSPSSEGVPLTIAAGQKLNGMQLAMWPTGSISGRIYDRDGDAVAHAQVNALRPIYRDGRGMLTIVQTVETNDRGEYRLFWLAPGRYYVTVRPDIAQIPTEPGSLNNSVVRATHISAPARFISNEQGTNPVIQRRRLKTGEIGEEMYVPIYYPGVTDEQGAAAIAVGAGSAVGGVDVSIGGGLVPARHIRGRVINATNGQPLAGAQLLAIPDTASPFVVIAGAQSDSSGAFDIAGTTTGNYLVFATRDRLSGTLPVQVGNNDLQNLAITARPSFNISGRFAVEGRPQNGEELAPSRFRVAEFIRNPNLLGMPSAGPSFNPPPEDDGSFTLEGVAAGDFRVTVRGVPRYGYVKSMRLGNVDVLDQGLHLAGPPESLLEIVIGLNAGTVTGSLVNARQVSLSSRTVVLVPDIRNRHRKDLYKTAITDSSGQFRMQGITPGDYTLFSWEDVETGIWHDPDFIRVYEGRGAQVHIREGSTENVLLTVIP
jgi:hypothetical protein